MLELKNKYINNQGVMKYGNNLFLLGIFFLPSAMPIGSLFLLISLVISFSQKKLYILKDKWNYPLMLCIGIIIFSSLNITFLNKPSVLFELDNFLIWINLLNWIPMFFIFWGIQIYLKTDIQRISFAKALLSGSLPVIISIFLHKFLNIYGPFKTLFGSVVWFMKPLVDFNQPVSGLFSNPNYASMWMILVLPFSIFFISYTKNSIFKRIIAIAICIVLLYFCLLTGSRNAIIGIVISLLFAFGSRVLKSGLFIFAFVLLNKILNNLFFDTSLLVNNLFIPKSLIDKFLDFNFFSNARLDIWQSTLIRIQQRPLLGWGGGTFSFLNEKDTSAALSLNQITDIHHSHNIFLELAHNFGAPLSIILLFTIIAFLVKSFIVLNQKSFNDKIISLDKFWVASIVIFLVNHLTDITFYDGKISIIISVILAGLKCILNESKEYKLNNKTI